jgi:outer membrane lipoprotein-sorting protein
MLRKFSLLLTIIVAFSLNCFGQTVDEIMEANLKASGSRAKIDSVKSWKIVTQIKNVTDNNSMVSRTIWYKLPDKFKIEITIKGKKIILGTDGNIFWGKNELAGNTKFEKIPDSDKEQIKEQLQVFTNLLWPSSYSYKKDSLEVEFMGVVDVDSTKKCSKIKFTDPKSKTVQYIYIDAITKLEYKGESEVVEQGQTYKLEQIIAEYQKSEGIYVPRKTVKKVNGVVQSESVYQTVTVNAKIADEFFKMPADVEPAK